MEQSPLKVEQLIKLLLAMNPRAEVYWHDADGQYRAFLDEDIEEIYAPEKAAKTIVQFGSPRKPGPLEDTV
ncbi:hypothetical protein [Paenibacillus typhae]|uniref:hypothetical protein n=1 Tax=Paenibacillus typhae TaxID=1174501 RepID=UPI001C8EF447|nr:hypothetical protein [Paenibacillus typhae]MBY0013872.1 hypothetical protein [Paenibacillus typhae]